MDCLVGPISSYEHLQQKAVSAWEQKTKGKSQSAKHEDLVLLLVLVSLYIFVRTHISNVILCFLNVSYQEAYTIFFPITGILTLITWLRC